MQSVVLENKTLKVEFSSLGAELRSLFDKRDGLEHMWHADPKFWPRKAPILFPCVGESKEKRIMVEGQSYPMGRHGFARTQEFAVAETNRDSVIFELTENAETLSSYPFSFRFRVSYKLDGASLIQTFEVQNTGESEMGFQVGGHPAFAVPFQPNEAYSDYEIRFDQSFSAERHLLSNEGLYNGETRLVLEASDRIPLSYELFSEDALVFRDIPSKSVWIQHKDGGKRLKVDYNGFPHLGIWSVPGADYACIEPWIGCADRFDQPDDFFKKDSIVRLTEKETFEEEFKISFELS